MGFKIIKTIKVREKDIDKYKEFDNADIILFDMGMEKSLKFPKNLITNLPTGLNMR